MGSMKACMLLPSRVEALLLWVCLPVLMLMGPVQRAGRRCTGRRWLSQHVGRLSRRTESFNEKQRRQGGCLGGLIPHCEVHDHEL